MKRSRNRSAGFLLTDALFGLSIVATLTVTLAIAVGQTARGTQRIRASAEATAIAERLLNDLHVGRRPPESPDGYEYRIEPVDGGDRAVDSGHWVRITVSIDGRSAELIGVIPAHMRGVIR